MARIVVSGYMIRYPLAGSLLAYFHYVLGLRRLEHRVTYIEESGWEGSCYDPLTNASGNSPQSGLAILRDVLARHDLDVPVYYVDRAGGAVYGGSRADVRRELADADLLLNLGGVCWLDEFALCRHRILIDMDPLFTQAGLFASKILGDYHVHLSYGMNIGRPGCTIPTSGYAWRGTVPPVVPELWSACPPGKVFTTIAQWSSYGAVEHEGESYGQKDVEFLRLLHVPRSMQQPLELALSGGSNDLWKQLELAGWSIIDGGNISRDLDRYRRYVCGSRGEFSAAKQAYVKTRSGWFSDRTVCYLAASRPVVIQDTGQSDWMSVGRGVLTFSTPEEAVDCLARVNADYDEHSRTARQIAMELFDYRRVLPRLMDTASTASPEEASS